MLRRLTGPYAGSFWLIGAALLPIHLLWFRPARRSGVVLFVLGMLVMAGMWGDHFMLLVITQHHDFLPSSQAHYSIGIWAVLTWIGTIGLFGTLLLLALAVCARGVDRRIAAARPSAGGGNAAWLKTRSCTGWLRSSPRRRVCWPRLPRCRQAGSAWWMPTRRCRFRGWTMRWRCVAPLLGAVALAAVLVGGFGCFAMITFATVADYPLNIGARPVWSWPLYVIPSFAAAMACGAVVVFVAMLLLDRLPRINHPVFEIDGSEGITQDRFFVAVEARSEDFDPDAVEHVLADLRMRPLRIQRVPR